MNKYKDVKFIADICCNHMGDFELAKKMILEAKKSGVKIVKFQKRDIATWERIKPDIYHSQHPNPNNSFGSTYKEHREFLEFDINKQKELKDFCNKNGLLYSVSVFDLNSAKEVININPDMIKIPSASNCNFELLSFVCDNYKGEIHLSLGMINHEEIDKILNFIKEKNRAKDLIIYACTSGYPVQPKDTCILEVKYLIEKYSDIVKSIGFSGHHLNTAIDIGAYVLGAEYIERHFTLDRDFKGTDHKLSLLPNEISKLLDDLSDVKESLQYKPNSFLEIEQGEREKLRWE